MLRAIAAAFALTLIVAPAGAQSHPGSHSMAHPHDSLAHPPMDPTLHAVLHGTWAGNLVSARGSSEMRLSIANDGLHGTTVKLLSAPAGPLAKPSTLATRGDTLRWQQKLADKTCPATAILSTLKPTAGPLMKGSLACEGGDMTFVLHKTGS